MRFVVKAEKCNRISEGRHTFKVFFICWI